MEIRTIILLSSMLIPLIIFLFFQKFLNEQKYQNNIRTILYTLATIGIVMFILKDKTYAYFLSLLSPLISYWIYRLCLLQFRKKMGRDPIDTTMDMRGGLATDRLFNIAYVIIGVLIPYLIMIFIVTN